METSLFDDALIGDFFPENWLRSASAGGSFWKDLLEDENRLFNLYVHSLKDNARALRTPTTYCTANRLARDGFGDQLETLINVCVSKAKKAREQLRADVLISGCIGPVDDPERKTDLEIRREIEETAVYLSDFGADSLLIQNIASERLLALTLECVRSVTGAPLAVFFRERDFSRENAVKELSAVCEEYRVELCGLQTPADSAAVEALHPGFFSLPFGLQLESPAQPADWASLAESLKKRRPLMVVGGESLSRKDWREFIRFL